MRKLIVTGLLLLACLFFSAQKKIATDLVYLVKEAAVKSDTAPVLIMLHGYGSNEADLFDMTTSFDGRYTVFSLRGPVAVDGGGFCWYPLEFLPDQRSDSDQIRYDYAVAKKSRTAVLSFISQACKTYHLDSNRVFLMGYSQGTILSYDIAIAAPKKIKGVAALSGRMLDETMALKTDWQAVAKQNYFIAHGLSDNVIRLSDAKKAADFLKLKKVTRLSWETYQMPHSISGKELNDIKDWLREALNKSKAPATQPKTN